MKATSPGLERVCLVHGEPEAQDAFAAQLEAGGYQASCPGPGDRVTL